MIFWRSGLHIHLPRRLCFRVPLFQKEDLQIGVKVRGVGVISVSGEDQRNVLVAHSFVIAFQLYHLALFIKYHILIVNQVILCIF